MRDSADDIRGEVRNALLSEYVSLQRSLGEDGEGWLADVLADERGADPERILIERKMAECLDGEALEDLSELEYEVLQDYMDGRSYEAMAGRLGRPANAVDNALQRAKRKAGRRLAELN